VPPAPVVQYAEDTQVLVSGAKSTLATLVGDMEASLASLDSYFRSNGLKINVSKFELLPIGTRQNLRNLPAFTVKFRGTDLAPCSEARNLGLTFDRYLSWDTSCSSALSEVCRYPDLPLPPPSSSPIRLTSCPSICLGFLARPLLSYSVWTMVTVRPKI